LIACNYSSSAFRPSNPKLGRSRNLFHVFHFKPNKLFWGLLENNAGSDNRNLINQDPFNSLLEREEKTKNKQLSLDDLTFQGLLDEQLKIRELISLDRNQNT
jgi:hypothetical protein